MASANKRLRPTLNSSEDLVLFQKLARVRRFLKVLRNHRITGLRLSVCRVSIFESRNLVGKLAQENRWCTIDFTTICTLSLNSHTKTRNAPGMISVETGVAHFISPSKLSKSRLSDVMLSDRT